MVTMRPDGYFDQGDDATEVWLDHAGVTVGALIPDEKLGPMLSVAISMSQPTVGHTGYITPPTRFVVVGTVRELARLVASIEEHARRAELVDAYSAALDQMRMWVRGSREWQS